MPTHIQIREKTKERLEEIKEEQEHTSFDSVIKSLLEKTGWGVK